MTITLIAAVARNGVIGADGGIPWRLPGELAHFKATTMGHTLIMGRATFDSIGRALPGRRTIVISRNPHWSAPGAERAAGLAEALARAGSAEVFIAGGAQVYAAALPVADRMILTHVDAEPPGDTFFPAWDPAGWVPTDASSGPGYEIVTYARVHSAETNG